MKILLLIAVLTSPLTVNAEDSKFAGLAEMNGYKFTDYKDFEKTMKLVTVRYRRDSGEMRFTYANDIAFNAFKTAPLSFPEGSVFLKVGIKTQDDPSFTSSAVPSGARRFQLMVKNKKKHSGTDGWGYAIFDQDGKTFPENPDTQIIACHACHKLVPSRDYVFSQPFSLTGASPVVAYVDRLSNTFKETLRANLSEIAAKQIPTEFKTVSMFENPLIQKNPIRGTLDELRPTLQKEAISKNRPAGFISSNGGQFIFVFPAASKKNNCKDASGHSGNALKEVSLFLPDTNIYENSVCFIP